MWVKIDNLKIKWEVKIIKWEASSNKLVNWLPSLECLRVAWRFQEKMNFSVIFHQNIELALFSRSWWSGAPPSPSPARHVMLCCVLAQENPLPVNRETYLTWFQQQNSNKITDRLLMRMPLFDCGAGNLSENQELLNSNLSYWWVVLSCVPISPPPVKIRNFSTNS